MKEWLIFALGLVLLGVVAIAVSSAIGNASGVTQPIAFKHSKHTKILACDFCHKTVKTSAAAGLPGKEVCMVCHQSKVTDSPEPEKIKAYVASGEEIPWVRLFAVNDDIVYRHQPHISAGVECQVCHGNVGSSEKIVEGFGRKGAGGPYGRDLMEKCFNCHLAKKAPTDCYTCHK